MSFRWEKVDAEARKNYRSVEWVVAEVGRELEREQGRRVALNALLSQRVDELELQVTRHRYYLLLSCAFEACILLYLFSR